MNGAELPCGTVIGVQPAEVDYKSKSKKNGDRNGTVAVEPTVETLEESIFTSEAASGATTASGRSREMKDKTPEDEGDDLDDFFASLE